MPLPTLLHSIHKRSDALNDLEEVYDAVFGRDLGSEPGIYADYDQCVEFMGKMRRAIDALRVS